MNYNIEHQLAFFKENAKKEIKETLNDDDKINELIESIEMCPITLEDSGNGKIRLETIDDLNKLKKLVNNNTNEHPAYGTDELITDKAIEIAWGNANFGGEEISKRKIIANALLKYAAGYFTGYTIQQIIQELGLAKTDGNNNTKLTQLGKEYLFLYYSKGVSV